MLVVGIIFLSLAVLFGLIILNAILKNRRTPKPIVFLHGAVALFAILVMVGYIAAGNTASLLIASLVLFILAAIGGITMLTIDIKKKPIPKVFAIVHPLIGVSGFVTLIVYVLQQQSIT